MDIFEAMNCHNMEAERCPSCGSDMWRFELPGGENYNHTEWVDEYGNVTDDCTTHVDDVAGYIWNAKREDDHAPILCPACGMDWGYEFPQRYGESGSVVVHYGETDERSAFSVNGNLVLWEFEIAYEDDLTDLWGLPGGEKGLPVALAGGSLSGWLDDNGWVEIAEQTVKDAVEWNSRAYKAGPEYRELAKSWAKGDETHPDLDFTYVMSFVGYGHPSFFVAEENRDELIEEIGELINRKL
jgi:hypothetical protein